MRNAILYLICTAMILLFAACQPTPEREFLVNKNEGVVEGALAATPAPTEDQLAYLRSQTPKPYEESIAKKPAYQIWQEDMDYGKTSLHFKNEIEIPDRSTFAVYGLKHFQPTDEFAARFVAYFAGDATGVRGNVMTREQLEQEYLRRLAGDTDPATGETTYPSKEELEQLEKRILEAPYEAYSSFDVNNSEIKLPINGTYKLADGINVVISIDSGVVQFKASDDINGTQPESWVMDGTAILGMPAHALEHVNISKDTALEVAQKTLNDLGISGMDIAETTKSRLMRGSAVLGDPEEKYVYAEGWMVTFVRNNGGYIPMSFEHMYSYTWGESPPDVAVPFTQESIQIFVNENGVQYLHWNSPMEITEVLNENVTLMPFEDIQYWLLRYLKSAIAYRESECSSLNRYVERIALTSCTIPKKDSTGEYILCPIWIVVYSEDGDTLYGRGYFYMAVNAIDGSSVAVTPYWKAPEHQ